MIFLVVFNNILQRELYLGFFSVYPIDFIYPIKSSYHLRYNHYIVSIHLYVKGGKKIPLLTQT